MGPPPWFRPVVRADHVMGALICQTSSVTTDNHVHDYDEWWLVPETARTSRRHRRALSLCKLSGTLVQDPGRREDSDGA